MTVRLTSFVSMESILRRDRDHVIGELARANAKIEQLRTALERLLVHGGCSPQTPCPDCENARQALAE